MWSTTKYLGETAAEAEVGEVGEEVEVWEVEVWEVDVGLETALIALIALVVSRLSRRS